jgi:hypothetical protein
MARFTQSGDGSGIPGPTGPQGEPGTTDYNDLENKPNINNASVDWTENHFQISGGENTRYLIGDVVHQNGNLYVANFDNESLPVTNTQYWTNLVIGNRINIVGRDIPNIFYENILNTPTIPDAQIQSDWNQANNIALDYIKNKPTVPTGIFEPQYGSFYDTSNQTITIANQIKAMTYNTTDISQGVSIENNSEITISNAGIYNVQFSAQLHNNGGGGNNSEVNIWLSKNNTDIDWTNTRVAVNTNSPYVVASWNFFVTANANDYFEIMWSSNNTSVGLDFLAAGSHPAIPSVILTVNKIA